MNTNIQDLGVFNKACDDLLNGKYILIDVKINSIFNSINANEKVKDIVLSCLEENNFVDLFNFAVSSGSFVCPADAKQVVCLVYNLLYRLKNKDIDFYEFLNTYFPDDENADNQFYMFANAVIVPFKQAVGNLYANRHIIVDSEDYQNNHYNKIKTTVNLILQNMDSFKLDLNAKEEYKMLLNSLYSASDKNDKTLVYSLMIAIDYFTKHYKKVRKTYLSLEECFS